MAAARAVQVVDGARRDRRGQPDARRRAAGGMPGGDDMDSATVGRLGKASVGGVCGQQRALHRCLIGSRARDLERRPRPAAARARRSHTDPLPNGTIPPHGRGWAHLLLQAARALVSARVHGRRAADRAAHRGRHARPVHLLLRRRHARVPDRARDRARAHRGGDPHLAVAGLGPDPADLRLDRGFARRAGDGARLVGGDRRCRSCCSSATCRSRCWSRCCRPASRGS